MKIETGVSFLVQLTKVLRHVFESGHTPPVAPTLAMLLKNESRTLNASIFPLKRLIYIKQAKKSIFRAQNFF